jgi:DNA-binding MarR family transcriptional regulator
MANRITRDAAGRKAVAAAASVTVAPVHRAAAHLARRFHQVCLGVLSEVTEPAGFSPIEYAAFVAIDDEPGIDQRRLAARLAIDPVTAGQIVLDFERRAWAIREIDPTDRRVRRLTLTARGLEQRTKMRPLMLNAQDRILAPLSATERVQLLRLLRRVIEGNAPYARPGNGRRSPKTRTFIARRAKRVP